MSDDATLKAPAETASARGFVARHNGITYAVLPTELLVTADGTIIKQEPMIDYHEPRSAAPQTPPR